MERVDEVFKSYGLSRRGLEPQVTGRVVSRNQLNGTSMCPTDEEIIKAFGQALKEKRTELGLAHAELARKAGMKLEDIRGYGKGL